ncbi:MAG: THUMP domain-containing protein [Nitriliruptorales bacterium]|nr:THUMP domain-containing protein [Nitriliruptorales bacterium]
MPARRRLLVTLSGELHTKSRRTSRWFHRVLLGNLRSALADRCSDAEVLREGRRVYIEGPDLVRAAEVTATVFGVHRVDLGVDVPAEDLDVLTSQVAELARERIRGRTFAVRVRRRGTHDWSSLDAADAIGAALVRDSAGVDLDDPEVEVRVEVYADVAFVPVRDWDGPGGAPIGTQDRTLALLSGGFDSPVAAWMLMRRGSPVHFLHFTLECAASDHAMVVAQELWRHWGAGYAPTLWKVDFEPVRDALFEHTPSRLRQVVLKQLMFATADRLAEQLGVGALVTGESVGQVSSQTLHHLGEIDSVVNRTVLRPLAGFTKDEIIERSRRIGTEALSARAKEVCDLSDGPVAVAAETETLVAARDALPNHLVDDALQRLEAVSLAHWSPGAPLVPIMTTVPEQTRVVREDENLPSAGALAFPGVRQLGRASAVLKEGRDVIVIPEEVDRGPEMEQAS